MKRLTIQQVQYVAHSLAQDTMTDAEPIPGFETRYPGVLEQCINAPFQTFGGKQLYRTLIDKIAILFYLMIKNHPFENGNKRVAVTTLLYVLWREGKWIEVPPIELYNFAKWIAASPPKLKDDAVRAIRQFLRMSIVDVKKQ